MGFVKPNINSIYGCSPDGLVLGGGGIEIKCPSKPERFVKYVCGDWKEHLTQIQFSLFVTQRKWWDFVTYHPSFKEDCNYFQTRVFPDLELHKTFKLQLDKFQLLVHEREIDFLKNIANAT